MNVFASLFAWSMTLTLAAIFAALLTTGVLLAIAITDWRTQRIPNRLVGALLGCAALNALTAPQPDLLLRVIGALSGGGLFWLLCRIGRGALGLGDVKLVAGGGALLAWPALLPALLIGVLVGGGVAAWLLLSGRSQRHDRFAYGPYLALGIWAVYGWLLIG